MDQNLVQILVAFTVLLCFSISGALVWFRRSGTEWGWFLFVGLIIMFMMLAPAPR